MAELFTLLAAKAKLVGVAIAAAAVGGSVVALQSIVTTTPADSATTVTALHPPKIIREVADTSVAGGVPVTVTGAAPVAPACAGATKRALPGKLGALVSTVAASGCEQGADGAPPSAPANPTRAPKAHVDKPAKKHATTRAKVHDRVHAARSAPVAARQAPGADAPKAAQPTDAPPPTDAPEPTDAPDAAGSGGAGPGSGQGEH